MPLSYIIHEDGLDLDDAVDEHERAIWSAPLAGANFDEDNLTIYRYYKDRVIDTPAWTWFNTAANGDGRAAALAIRDHYVGPAVVNCHVAETEAKLDHLNWSNEVQFPFNTYISHMSECFQDLEEQDKHILEHAKVNQMLSQMTSKDPQVMALKTTVRAQHALDFEGACNEMSAQIAILYPGAVIEHKNKRRWHVSAAQCGRGHGRGHYGNQGFHSGPQNVQYFGSMDVRDPTRQFMEEEWQEIQCQGGAKYIKDKQAEAHGCG